MTPLKSEVKAITGLLTSPEEWDTPEALAKEIVKALDKARADRTLYVGVMVFGGTDLACGPYSTANQAHKGLQQHPALSMAKASGVVPLNTQEGVQQIIEKVDTPPESKGDYAEVKKDAEAKRDGWKGQARNRHEFLGG